jgi:hypothetical protein
MEQILRIDPKSVTQTRHVPRSTSFSARSIDTNISHSTANTILTNNRHPVLSPSLNSTKQQSYPEPLSNGKPFGQQQSYPMPVLRTQQTSINRSSVVTTQENSGFKPIEQQHSTIISDSTPRPTPIHPQTSQYSTNEKLSFVSFKNKSEIMNIRFFYSLVQCYQHMVNEHHNQVLFHLSQPLN